MLRKLLTILIITYVSVSAMAKADTAFVSGLNLTYAHQVIQVLGYDDFITRKMIILASDTVDSSGSFELSIPLSETRYVQIPLGYYTGLLFIEPGTHYNIVLPERKDKTFADLLNPYYQTVDVYLAVTNANRREINYLIDEFDNIYNEYVEKKYYEIFKNPLQSDVDTLIENVEKLFDTIPNTYFADYRHYKYAWLRYVSYMRNSPYVIKEYFNDESLKYQNIAYMDLFNQIFTNYLNFYMNTREGERIYSDIALAKSPYLAKQSLSNNLVLMRDSIQELALLKGINDAFYSKDFPIASLLITLDSIADSSKNLTHRKIANNIKEHVLQARAGYEAPNFELRDVYGAFRKRTDYLANYIYINFCSVESFTCQQDFALLKELYEKHKNDFKIISISIDPDFEKAKAFFKANNYDWILLSYNSDKEVLNKFRVKAFPSYYMVDPEGKLIMSPAAAPGENFEWRFFNYMKEKEREDLRKQNK